MTTSKGEGMHQLSKIALQTLSNRPLSPMRMR